MALPDVPRHVLVVRSFHEEQAAGGRAGGSSHALAHLDALFGRHVELAL